MHARDNVTVVTEEVQSLMRIEQQFEATVTLNETEEKKRGETPDGLRVCEDLHFSFRILFSLRSNRFNFPDIEFI